MKFQTSYYYIPDENATEAQKWLYRMINRRAMTQGELASLLHTTRQTVSKLFNGRTELTFDKICAICYVCHLDDPEEVWEQINAEEH